MTRPAVEVEPVDALERMRRGAVLIDVRDVQELATGAAQGSVHASRCELAARIDALVPDRASHVMLICESGRRSLAAADELRALGYANVSSVAGGLAQWRRAGLPVSAPHAGAGLDWERYARQVALPEIGEAGQRRLRASRILLVGAGGLGSPAALYLAAAGVGHLAIVDDDLVERSNLHRQVLHRDGDAGTPKVQSAIATLRSLNPAIDVAGSAVRIDPSNARRLIAGHDVVIDGSDNFATRYAVNDACVALGVPNVHGSVFRFEGQVTVLWPGRSAGRGPCYRCLYPAAPPPELAPSCAEAGVLGVVPGVIGMLQAAEALKIVLGIGDVLVGRLLQYDALRGRFDEFEVTRDPACASCART